MSRGSADHSRSPIGKSKKSLRRHWNRCRPTAHWSTRLMAEETSLSQNAIVRIWRAFGLQPHLVENFKFSKDPQFVEKVLDNVGLYLNPPDRAIVLCVDEK